MYELLYGQLVLVQLASCSYSSSYPSYIASYISSIHILQQIFMRMGLCKVVTSDQGKEFNNALNKELMKKLGIDHRLTTPYHPQVRSLSYDLHA